MLLVLFSGPKAQRSEETHLTMRFLGKPRKILPLDYAPQRKGGAPLKIVMPIDSDKHHHWYA